MSHDRQTKRSWSVHRDFYELVKRAPLTGNTLRHSLRRLMGISMLLISP